MKLLSGNSLMMLLPLTVVEAIVFGMAAAVAFRMEAGTAGFFFSTLSIAGWMDLFVEY